MTSAVKRVVAVVLFGIVGACAARDGSDASPAVDAGPSPPVSTNDGSVPDAPADAPPQPETVLFDGTSMAGWTMSTIKNQPGRDDPGRFLLEDGAMVSQPGTDLGLLWHERATPPDFVLSLEWKATASDDNSGVFVRFPDLASKGYDNTAWVAVHEGFEIQINEPGFPDGAPQHSTAAVYGETEQSFTRVPARPPGTWNQLEIRVEGNTFTTSLNGQPVTRFVNKSPTRGAASTPASPRYIGLQTHSGRVAFKNVKIRALSSR